jgi:hypothetical protein
MSWSRSPECFTIRPLGADTLLYAGLSKIQFMRKGLSRSGQIYDGECFRAYVLKRETNASQDEDHIQFIRLH